MGNYIKHEKRGSTIKIGTLDETFFSRKTLMRLKELGYKGFSNGEFNDELEEILSDESILYGYCDESHFIEWGLEDKIFYLPAAGVQHDPVIINHNGYTYKVDCMESNRKIIKAKLVGERFSDGKLTTVFRCNCCGKLFTITHMTAMLLRNVLPVHKQYFNSKYDAHVKTEDINLVETIEIMLDTYSQEELKLLLKNGDMREVNSALKDRGYNSLSEMYEQAKKLSELVEKTKKEMGINE